ncbi:protein HAIKU1-like [Ananas comosus]|uniref:Protein HAIKU1-like n=1 Tax=Ananas comosus TaxID=4615 RepID=A0A6P5FHA9_ANACO|nr:protein HAIKU1-like [Ananas comosus]
MDHSKNNHQQHHQHNPHLGVNKMGKNIRKSPLHPSVSGAGALPNVRPPAAAAAPPAQQQQQQQQQPPQPQVYNISKNDFRSIVQQLTGTPSRDPNPNPNPPIPPPAAEAAQPAAPEDPPLAQPHRRPLLPYRPTPAPPHPHPLLIPSQLGDSPVSAYMRYFESALLSSDGSRHPHLPSPALPSRLPPFLP